MNREEILAMEAGGKLDRLIKQEIMGGSALMERILPYHYSTDWWGAGLVVEKLDKDGFKFYAEPLSKGGFEVGFLPIDKLKGRTYWEEGWDEGRKAEEGWNELFLIVEDIAKFPGAICKAALLAKLGGG